MKVLIDACVLYPTVLRELVFGAAGKGLFQPLWSARILEEWQRAAARNGSQDAGIARLEIEAATAVFPGASVYYREETEERLKLPDENDRHVLAAAIDGGADELLTLNVKDFPTNTLSAEGIMRRHPDEFLLELLNSHPKDMKLVVDEVLSRAQSHGIDTSNRRALMKRAKLPRFGKALDQL